MWANTNKTITQNLEVDIQSCLVRLCNRLDVVRRSTTTHQLLVITGIDRSPDCLRDLAIYCVGQIAKAVQTNLEIRADLLGEGEEAQVQLVRDVCSVIGENNNYLTEIQKRDERDPWLFEALSHLIVHLSIKRKEIFPVGQLLGLTVTHRAVKEQGLDLVAIYTEATVGLSIGESKAYEDGPSRGLTRAIGKFKEIDEGRYEKDLRTIVGQMRATLTLEYQGQITGSFWKNERTYCPFIGYDANHRTDWTSNKKSLDSLAIPPTHRIIIPLPLENFRTFFDDLANAMQDYIATLGKR